MRTQVSTTQASSVPDVVANTMSPQQELAGLRTILVREGADGGVSLTTKPRHTPHRAIQASQHVHGANPPVRPIGGSVAHVSSLGVQHQGLVLGPKLASKFPHLARAQGQDDSSANRRFPSQIQQSTSSTSADVNPTRVASEDDLPGATAGSSNQDDTAVSFLVQEGAPRSQKRAPLQRKCMPKKNAKKDRRIRDLRSSSNMQTNLSAEAAAYHTTTAENSGLTVGEGQLELCDLPSWPDRPPTVTRH